MVGDDLTRGDCVPRLAWSEPERNAVIGLDAALTTVLGGDPGAAVIWVSDAPPHRGSLGTTVLIRFPNIRDGAGQPAHIARVLWYEDLTTREAYSRLAAELLTEAHDASSG